MDTDCIKQCKSSTAHSMIARLMDLHELSQTPPLHMHQRVLSESYIHKTATLGLRPRRSAHINHSRNKNNEILRGVSGVPGVQVCKRNNLFSVEKHPDVGTSTIATEIQSKSDTPALVSGSTCKPSYKERKSFSRNGDHHSRGNIQKLENVSSASQPCDLGIGYTNNFSKSKSEMIDMFSFASTRCSVFESKIKKVTDHLGDKMLDLDSRSENGKIFMSESRKHEFKLAAKGRFDKNIVLCGNNGTTNNQNVNRRYGHRRLIDSSKGLSTGANYPYYPEALSPSCSVVAHNMNCNSGPHRLINQPFSEVKKSEDWETRKRVQRVESLGWDQFHYNLDAFPKMKLMPKYARRRLGRSGFCKISSIQGRNSCSISSPVFSTIKCWENEHLRNTSFHKLQAIKSRLYVSNVNQVQTRKCRNMPCRDEISLSGVREPRCGSSFEKFSSTRLNRSKKQRDLNVEVSSYYSCTDSDNDHPEAYKTADETSTCSEDDTFRECEFGQEMSFSQNWSSCIMELPSAKESINESSEDILSYSKYYRNPPVIHKYLEEINHSPDSVLEPSSAVLCNFSFNFISTRSFIFPFSDQQSQLQILNSKLVEKDFPESEIGKFGEAKEIKEFIRVNHGSVISFGRLGDNKSRDFSYLVDVLDKARIFSENLIMNIESWCCLECPISPAVFEALEKEYGRHMSWQKSDRLLLFDLINCGLIQMVNQIMNFHVRATSAKSVTSGFDRDEVESKLWTMLIMQEKEKSRDMFEKDVEGAMNTREVNEDISIIFREIEVFLFDELVGEYISLWHL